MISRMLLPSTSGLVYGAKKSRVRVWRAGGMTAIPRRATILATLGRRSASAPGRQLAAQIGNDGKPPRPWEISTQAAPTWAVRCADPERRLWPGTAVIESASPGRLKPTLLGRSRARPARAALLGTIPGVL